MADLQRHRVHWSGFQGAPGISTFYLPSGAVGFNTAARAFYNAVGTYLPSGVVISFDTSGDDIDETTGKLTGVWGDTSVATVLGSGSGAFNGAGGAVVEWLTAETGLHRRVMGKTFIVPLVQGAYDTAGTLSSAFQSALLTAANTMLAALTGANALMVWQRPKPSLAGEGIPITGARVPDLAAVLRSRRD